MKEEPREWKETIDLSRQFPVKIESVSHGLMKIILVEAHTEEVEIEAMEALIEAVANSTGGITLITTQENTVADVGEDMEE